MKKKKVPAQNSDCKPEGEKEDESFDDLLKYIEKEADICFQCGYCTAVCPVWMQFQWCSSSPRGKMLALRERLIDLRRISRKGSSTIKDNKKEAEDEDKDRKGSAGKESYLFHLEKLRGPSSLFYCTMCLACQQTCHVGIEFGKLWPSVRKMLLDGRGVIKNDDSVSCYLPTGLEKAILSVSDPKTSNPSGLLFEKKKEFFDDVSSYGISTLPKEEDNKSQNKEAPADGSAAGVFFGCNISLFDFRAASALGKLAKKAGIKLYCLEEEKCCGRLLSLTSAGQWQHSCSHEGNLKTNSDMLRIFRQNRIVLILFLCPGCLLEFEKASECLTTSASPKELPADEKMNLLHIDEWLINQIETGFLRFRQYSKIDGKYLYHRPCELFRVRQLHGRTEVNSLTLMDYLFGKDGWEEFCEPVSKCCGAGCGFRATAESISLEIAAMKIRYALERGFAGIITSCPSCKNQFKNALARMYQLAGSGENTEDEGMKNKIASFGVYQTYEFAARLVE
ncbi:MAG: heterodisulfide reductase-related iron-sulfur binding cluster [Thermoplasmata archaeon]